MVYKLVLSAVLLDVLRHAIPVFMLESALQLTLLKKVYAVYLPTRQIAASFGYLPGD